MVYSHHFVMRLGLTDVSKNNKYVYLVSVG